MIILMLFILYDFTLFRAFGEEIFKVSYKDNTASSMDIVLCSCLLVLTRLCSCLLVLTLETAVHWFLLQFLHIY